MNRLGAGILALVLILGFAAAAVLSPRSLQPAGARAELARLMTHAIDELEAMLPEATSHETMTQEDAEVLAPAEPRWPSQFAEAQLAEVNAVCTQNDMPMQFLTEPAISDWVWDNTRSSVRVVVLCGDGVKTTKDFAWTVRKPIAANKG